MKSLPERRRRLNVILDKDFQFRFSLKILLSTGIVFALFGGTFLFLIHLNYDMLIQDALIQMPDAVSGLRREFRLVAYGMIAAFILMLGSIFMITMIMSLRIVGPLYALRKRLKDFADGKSGLRLNLRNKDEFQTLEETFNLAMENHDLRQRHLRENIGRVNEHLKNGEADAAKELLRELQRELPERHFIL